MIVSESPTSAPSASAPPGMATPAMPTWLPVQIGNIPRDLIESQRWVVWRAEYRNNKWTKTPRQATRDAYAKSNDPKTWASFSQAVMAARREGIHGIGYVFSAADKLVGVDLDHCRDTTTGAIEPWAHEILSAFSATYAEISPSGSGVKLFCRGTIPTGLKQGNIELYSTGRYFTVTGHQWAEHPGTIADCQAALTELYERVKVAGRPTVPPEDAGNHSPVDHADLSDDRILELARSAKNGSEFSSLHSGSWQGAYPSQSEADLALCNHLAFYTGPNPDRIDRLFRQSGLYRSDKWDTKHHSDGSTYGGETIRRSLAGRTEFYAPKKTRNRKKKGVSHHITQAAIAGGFALTDSGNAERLVARHGRNLRYIYQWGKWIGWSGTAWTIDHVAMGEQATKETARSILADAALIEDDDSRDELVEWAKQSEAATRRRAMLQLAKSEPGVAIEPSELDHDPFLLNCVNCTIDLKAGTPRPHRREDYLTKICPTIYDPLALCPLWLSFQDRICNHDARLLGWKQRFYGWCLTGDVSEHILAIAYGIGANGKSVEIETMLKVLGLDYGMKAVSDLLMAKRNDAHPTERADLFGKRLVACVETADGRRLAEELVKELTGGDTLRARRMREDFWQFAPTHKLILATNHKPVVRGTDHGIWRRLRLIPYSVTIPEHEQDKRLKEKLLAERAGILAWCVQGCLEWQRVGLGNVDTIKQATSDYQGEQDLLGDFIATCCDVGECEATARELFDAYVRWTGDEKMPQKRFGMALKELGAVPFRGRHGVRMYKGIGLKQE